MANGRKIQLEHPPMRQIKVSYMEQTIEAAPYKNASDNVEHNVKNIIQQNNFINTHLSTIAKQLSRIEETWKVNVDSPVEPTKLKLKNPVFKPFQVSKTSQKLYKDNKSEFIQAL